MRLVSFFIMIICTKKRIIGSLGGISVGGRGVTNPLHPLQIGSFQNPPTPHIQPKQQTINYKKSNYCNTPNQPFMCQLRLCRHNFDFVVIEAKTGFICRLNEKDIIRYYNCFCFFGNFIIS